MGAEGAEEVADEALGRPRDDAEPSAGAERREPARARPPGGAGRTCSRTSRGRRRSCRRRRAAPRHRPRPTRSRRLPRRPARGRARRARASGRARPRGRRPPLRGSPRCPSRTRRRARPRPLDVDALRRAIAGAPDELGDRVVVPRRPHRPVLLLEGRDVHLASFLRPIGRAKSEGEYDRSCYFVNVAVAPSTRRPSADGERSRQKILQAAAELATVEGLNGLSIGRLADPRRHEQERALCALSLQGGAAAGDGRQPRPGSSAGGRRACARRAGGARRLVALCDAFISHVERRVFPGGASSSRRRPS